MSNGLKNWIWLGAAIAAATFGCENAPTPETAELAPEAQEALPQAPVSTAAAAAGEVDHTLSDIDHPLTNVAQELAGLSRWDRDTVLLVREQEKLARDVYAALSQTWRLDVFNTTSGSEEIHSDALRTLLARHKLPDPGLGLAPGEFTLGELTELHDRLIARGKLSPLEALKACASVEEMEITGIDARLALTQAADIQHALEGIVRSDHHHLRSLVEAMRKLGHAYVPSRLSRDQLGVILGAAS